MRLFSFIFNAILGLCLTAIGGYVAMVTLRYPAEGPPPTMIEWLRSVAVDAIPFKGSNRTAPRATDPFLKAYRVIDADLRLGQLSVSGAAFTFTDLEDPNTIVPYNFSFRHDHFTATPTINFPAHEKLYQRVDVNLPKTSGVVPETCINPRPQSNSTASGVALKTPLLCHLQASLPNSPPAMVGVIQPASNVALRARTDSVCRAELNHWITLSTFEDIPIVFCIVVDRPFLPDAYSADLWMDVIIYQRGRRRISTLRAAGRNF